EPYFFSVRNLNKSFKCCSFLLFTVSVPAEGSMPTLKLNPSLRDFQVYVSQLESERGFSSQGPLEKCLLLGEEIGELFKSVRKSQKIGIDEKSKVDSVANELADIFIYLCSIANRYDVDLETAFLAKEEENKNRIWK
ncbi:MAG: MazG nucleotide pyrophosphohydrolase domain-containing protein, partial [Candidatus Pacebacteria bacterium]|nr:MazG nucleotide pyrophosphohydrolase domain-containing protein [Candidatus Paceibacterota bacterium]